MNKSKLLIIGMMLGFEKGHDIFEGLDWNSDMASGLLEARTITKEDFFATTAKGKSFFEYKRAWENLRKVFDFVKKNGEQIGLADFKRVIVNNKNAIELAIECKALDEIFIPEIWAGHSREMEDMWFSIDKWKRPSKNFDELRIGVARLEGRVIREDKLKSIGIPPQDMHTAVKNGNLADMKKKLDASGEHFTLDDVKICDADGDHGLHTSGGWGKFEELYAEWEKHGQVPDAAFFNFRRGTRASIIEAAFTANAEKKVFNAKVFAGRPEELLKLYQGLKEEHRKKVDVRAVLSEIIEKECADQLQIDLNLKLEHLTMPLYHLDGGEKGSIQITGLGLKKCWEQMDLVRDALSTRGEYLSLGHLRESAGLGGETGMFKAARYGHFDKVLEIAAQNGERLEVADLTAKNESGKSVLTVLAETDKVGLLLKPELWVRRVGDLAVLWENLPANVKTEKKPEFLAVQTRANQLSLRELGRGAAPAPSMAL